MNTQTLAPPFRLKDAYKGDTLDQDKLCAPADTVTQVKQRFKQLNLKILEDTVRIDNGRLNIPVYLSLCGSEAQRLTQTARQMGKGATPQQAEASAVMELVERYSVYSFAETAPHFITDTYANVKDRALPFDLIAQSVHDQGEDVAASKKIFADLPMRWTLGVNLTRDCGMLVPFDWFFAVNEFNGSSAGNCAEEALCQGICEVVERHVSAVISRDNPDIPGIRTDTATDAMVVDMLNKYRQNGIRLYASDFTLNMGIPSVGVLAYDPSTFPEKSEIVWTAGTATSPEKSFSRALSEVAQLAGDFNTATRYAASGLPKIKHIENAGRLLYPEKMVSLSLLPNISHPNMKIEVENCIQALAAHGMEVLSINITHPRLDIPAFYTMIPGARFRQRAASGSIGMFVCKLIVQKYSPREAIFELTRIEKILSGKYYLQFYLGSCHLGLNDPKTAYGHFMRALELNPHPQDIPGIYSYMGLCLKDLGDYRSAIDVLKKGASLDPDRTDIHNLMGFCYFKLKQHEASIKSFEQVVSLNPASAIDYANIASNYRDMGDTDRAIAYYRIALNLDPDIDFAKKNLEKLTRG